MRKVKVRKIQSPVQVHAAGKCLPWIVNLALFDSGVYAHSILPPRRKEQQTRMIGSEKQVIYSGLCSQLILAL